MSEASTNTMIQNGSRSQDRERDDSRRGANSYFPYRELFVGVHRHVATGPVGLHSHDFSELVVIAGGYSTHVTTQETWPVAAGDVFVIGRGIHHGYRKPRDLHVINILFYPEELQVPEMDIKALPGYHTLFALEPAFRKRHRFESRLRLKRDSLARIESLVETLENEIESGRPGFRYMTTAVFMQIVCLLSRAYSVSTSPASRELLRIGRAISHLEDFYNERIDLEGLSKIAGMSKRNFLRVFKNATGSSPIDYLVNLRVAKAGEFLRRSEMTVTEIAFSVGFEDSNYFARQFKRVTGTTPSTFRRSSFLLPKFQANLLRHRAGGG